MVSCRRLVLEMKDQQDEMMSDDSELNRLFEQYRSACPEMEPSSNFMPSLWEKIEARRGGLWFNFSRVGKNALAVSAVLCLLLLGMNIAMPPQVGASYADALISAGSAEQVDFSEAIRPASPEEPAADQR